MVNPYCATAKDYAKNTTRKQYTRLTGTLKREKTAIIYLRTHFNYSINELAKFFSRSQSLIHRTLKFNAAIGAIKLYSQRKLPNTTRLISAQNHRAIMGFFMQRWETFLLGLEDKPP